MNNVLKGLILMLLTAGTAIFALTKTVVCLWQHRFPTTTEVLALICLCLVTRSAFVEST